MKKTKALLDRLVEEIEKTPLVQVACDKVGISRNTFYRWVKEDPELPARVNEAMSLGMGVVNDVAVSNVLEGIKKKDIGYTKYWLTNNHPNFKKQPVPRSNLDDVLEYTHLLSEGAKKYRLQQEIQSADKYIDQEAARRQEEGIKDFMEKWQHILDKGDEERAQVLFEKWKKEYESEGPVTDMPETKKTRKKNWR